MTSQYSVLGTRYSVLRWFLFFLLRLSVGIEIVNGGTTAGD